AGVSHDDNDLDLDLQLDLEHELDLEHDLDLETHDLEHDFDLDELDDDDDESTESHADHIVTDADSSTHESPEADDRCRGRWYASALSPRSTARGRSRSSRRSSSRSTTPRAASTLLAAGEPAGRRAATS